MLTTQPHSPPADIAASTSRWAKLWPVALIALAGLAAYHNSFSVPFLFDDEWSIVDNPAIRHLWPVWDALSSKGATGLTTSGRPVLSLTLALNYAMSGMAVWSYHAMNLAIHILAGLTLFGIVRRTLLRPPLQTRFGRHALPLALVVALIWTLHPLQTEAVTYIIQRAESVMGMFYLLTLYGFIRAAESPRPLRWQIATVAACLLGMTTKEVLVTAPMLLLLYDRALLSSRVAGGFQEAWRQRRGLYVGLAATWIPLGLLVASTGGNRGGMFVFNFDAVKSYWLTQCEAITRYVGLSVWPHPLVFEYGPFWVHRAVEVAPYAAVVVLLAGATLVALWRWPAAGFLGAWFFIILAPTSLTPGTTEMIVEHRMYLPLAAVVTLVVMGMHRWMGRYGLAAGLALAVGCGWLTFVRNQDYRSELSLWKDTVAKRPLNGLAQLNYGSALFALGRFREAGEHFAAALRIRPDDAEAENNLGAALAHMGHPQEAIAHYEAALRLKPGYAKADYELGLVLLDVGRAREAGEHLERALRGKPDNAEAENNLGVALARTGRPQEAAAHYEAALRIIPDYAEAEYNLASLLLAAGQTQGAVGHLEQALRLRPGHPDMLNNLAGALLKLGRAEDAIARYEQALRLSPERPDLHNNLGVALAKAGRLDEAIAQFREAIRLKPDYAGAHLALALALSQAGREQEATAQREEGLRLKARLLSAPPSPALPP